MIDLPPDPQSYGNVEQAGFLLRLTEGEPWEMPLRWETEAERAIDISGPGWTVAGVLKVATGDRPAACFLTNPVDGWFKVRLEIADVAALDTARPDRLVVTIGDPTGRRFHFLFAAIRRVL